jgi:hypothetical protein
MMTVIKDGFVGSLPSCGDTIEHRLSAIGTYFRNGYWKKTPHLAWRCWDSNPGPRECKAKPHALVHNTR